MLETLQRALDGTDDGFFEWRRCGTAVERSSATCQACGSQDIARYEL